MVKHYILMSSSYTDGTRIALDITGEDKLNSKTILEIIQEIQQNCGNDVPLSTHMIETESNAWESVAKYDPFFEDVVCMRSVNEFWEKIKKDRTLSGLDVANYILSKVKCTHLSLEKLVYFAYADYLCAYSERLFQDKIYAYTFGPVVESVYEIYKRSGTRYLEPTYPENEVQTNVKEMPAKSRILFAKNGVEKLHSIDQTIQKYGQCTAGELVTLTHLDGSPWSRRDSKKPYQIISDELIKAHHHMECIE